MGKNKKFVSAITSRDEDFAKWYTDIVKKAELTDYSGIKGCMIIRPYGYAIWENIQADRKKSAEKLVIFRQKRSYFLSFFRIKFKKNIIHK